MGKSKPYDRYLDIISGLGRDIVSSKKHMLSLKDQIKKHEGNLTIYEWLSMANKEIETLDWPIFPEMNKYGWTESELKDIYVTNTRNREGTQYWIKFPDAHIL